MSAPELQVSRRAVEEAQRRTRPREPARRYRFLRYSPLVLLGGLVIQPGVSSSLPLESVAPAEQVASSADVPQFVDEAFGFETGEERRYILGPKEALLGGEEAWWSISLDDIEGEGDDLRIIFELEHERDWLATGNLFAPNGQQNSVRVEARLTVNRFGFPERLVMQEQHVIAGELGDESDIRTTIFNFDGKYYIKQVRISGNEWEFEIPIARHDNLDLEGHTGLYLFFPSALECLGGRQRSRRSRSMDCSEGEVAFANPGLLSLALPILWEEQVNERDFLFFKPRGVGTVPAGLINMRRFVASERDRMRNLSRYYQRTKLEFEELDEVEVGPRTLDAWKIDPSGGMREFWVDRDGTVLKVLLSPHPETYRDRWIRLQYASEY